MTAEQQGGRIEQHGFVLMWARGTGMELDLGRNVLPMICDFVGGGEPTDTRIRIRREFHRKVTLFTQK